MYKIVIHRAGGYERLAYEPHPDPRPAAGEVRVKTAAIGVNYADCIVRMGLYASAKKYVGWPITPGFEFAGCVDALGAGVSDVALGTEVFGVTRFGGYASHVCVPRGQVFRRPDTLSVVQAATMPSVYLTAWFALFELAHPRTGDDVLVHSAAGGVGGMLVQLAARHGCRVTGVVGASHKIQLVQSLGARHVIDKSRESVWARAESIAPRGFAVILDANGVATLRESYRHLGSPGKLVVYGFHSMIPRKGGKPDWLKLALDWVRTPRFDPLGMTGDNRSVMAFNLSYLFDRADLLREAMDNMLASVADGTVRPLPVESFALRDAASAHRAIESGQTVGKLVLVP